MKGRYGKRIRVPIKHANGELEVKIYLFRNSGKTELRVDTKDNELKGRPSKVLKQFVKKGFEEKWWGKDILIELMRFGYREKLWTDFFTLRNEFWELRFREQNRIQKDGKESIGETKTLA